MAAPPSHALLSAAGPTHNAVLAEALTEAEAVPEPAPLVTAPGAPAVTK